MSIGDENRTIIEERVVLSKFEGEPLPENEFERIHVLNGSIVAVEKIENGVVIHRREYQPGAGR